MKTGVPMQIGIRELKAKLSEFVHRAQDGEHIEITDHGTPVAHIVPIPAYYSAEEEGMILRDPTPPYDATGSTRTKHKRTIEPTKQSYASLVKEAQNAWGHKTARETETRALEEYLRYKKRLSILDLAGTIDFHPDYNPKDGRRKR
jgi:prevent-host-death family protein